MGEFFKSWRRKIGVVTLLTACAFSAWWVRSLDVLDEKVFVLTNTSHCGIASCKATLAIQTACVESPLKITNPQFDSVVVSFPSSLEEIEHNIPPYSRFMVYEDEKPMRQFELLGMSLNYFDADDPKRPLRVFLWKVPFWSIVVPLTLISAFMLLSKPDKPNQRKTNGPAAKEGP